MDQNAKNPAVENEIVAANEAGREDKPTGVRPLSDWELVRVGGGESTDCW